MQACARSSESSDPISPVQSAVVFKGSSGLVYSHIESVDDCEGEEGILPSAAVLVHQSSSAGRASEDPVH